MFRTRYATELGAVLLACTAVMVTLAAGGVGAATGTATAQTPVLTANNSTTPNATTTTPTAANASLTPADVRRTLRTVDPANASRERIARLADWARDPGHVRTLSAGEVRRLRLWLLDAGRAAGLALDVPAIDLAVDGTPPTTTTTSTTTARPNESNGRAGSAGFGVVREVTRNPGNVSAQQVEQTIVDGLYVTDVEFSDRGYALVTVVVTRPQMTFSVTDSNSIGDRGSGRVAAERVHLPRGKFIVKVPASVEDDDQTIVVGVNVENSYWFSNHATAGEPGILSRVGGWTPWIGGILAALSWVVIAGVVVLAGEQSGVEIAGERA